MSAKSVLALLFSLLFISGLIANNDHNGKDGECLISPVPLHVKYLMLQENAYYQFENYSLKINQLHNATSGTGEFFFKGINQNINIEFEDLILLSEGQIINGSISDLNLSSQPLNIISALEEIQNMSFPKKSEMFLEGLVVNSRGAFADLAFDAATIVENEYLDFRKSNYPINLVDVCFDDLNMFKDGEGKINDFEFPIRILAGNPLQEGEGSYITFDCKGFKNFNLAAEYDFPENQLKPFVTNAQKADAEKQKAAAAKEGKTIAKKASKDTVRAYFKISSPQLGSYMAMAKIDPFQVPGVDDMGFVADSVFIDYSDTTNVPNFKYVDKKTKAQVDNKWKGIFIKKIALTLPASITSFNGGTNMEIAARNLVYSRGDGITFDLSTTNILDIKTGSLNGWGVSIDTLALKIEYSSFEKFELNGLVYIPITGKDENINYSATFGKDSLRNPQANFVLKLGATYTVPFLNKAKLKLAKSSIAGVKYSNKKYEPFADLSGVLDVTVGGDKIPEVKFPELGFQHLTLGDIKRGIKQGAAAAKEAAKKGVEVAKEKAKEAKEEVTAGLDKMQITALTLGGETFQVDTGENPVAAAAGVKAGSKVDDKKEDKKDDTGKKNGKQQKLGKFPISIKKWSFKSEGDDKKDDKTTQDGTSKDADKKKDGKKKERLKVLAVDFGLNFTGKKGGGLAGEANLAIKGKLDYAKLLSEPSKALQYKGVGVGYIALEGQVGPCGVKGMLSFISQHEVYGSGLKGGMELFFKSKASGGGGFQLTAIGQFGGTEYKHKESYRYFFVDVSAVSSKALFAMYGVAFHGFGGGLYYNMDKGYTEPPKVDKNSKPEDTPKEGVMNPEPGVSLSKTKYTPKYGTIGLNASTVIAVQGKPDVLSADVEFGIQINYDKGGVENITFSGGAYAMAEDLFERKKAPIQAHLNLKVDFTQGVLTGKMGYTMKYPTDSPTITGKGDGSFQADLDKNDGIDRKNYFVFGTPSKRFNISAHIPNVGKIGEVTGYVMIGDSLEGPSGLPNGFEEFSKTKSYQAALKSRADKIAAADTGAAFGMTFRAGKAIEAGPIFASLRLLLGYDLALLKLKAITCSNNSDEPIGFNSWYAIGQAYAGIEGSAGINVKVWKWNKKFSLLDLNAKALLQAELPNPTWIKGDVAVKGSVLGGKIKVDKKVGFELGEKCAKSTNAEDLIANFEAISETQPTPDQKDFQVYHEPRIAFNYPASDGFAEIPKASDLIEMQVNDNEKFVFFPFVESVSLKEKASGEKVDCDRVWDDSKKVLSLKTKSFLKSKTEYVLDVNVIWSYKKNNNPCEYVKDKKTNKPKSETRSVTFTSASFPDKIIANMINAKRHMPGNLQRNYHRNFAIAELQFDKQGGESYFAETKEKTVNGKKQNVKYKYEIWVTDINSGQKKTLPLTKKPGESKYKYYKKRKVSSRNGYMIGYDLVTEYNRQIEFEGLNAEGFLEKNKIYKLQVVGLPQNEGGELDNKPKISTKAEEKVSQGGYATITTVKTKLSEQVANAALSVPKDVLYEYYFKTSKYNSLKEKIDKATYVNDGPIAGTKVTSLPYPYAEQMKEFNPFRVSKTEAFSNFNLFDSDESLDNWDKRRLRFNLSFEEATQKHRMHNQFFEDKPTRISSMAAPQNSRMWYIREGLRDKKLKLAQTMGIDFSQFISIYDAILTDPWDVPGYWFDVHFPNQDTPGTLTQAEIDAKEPRQFNSKGRPVVVKGDSGLDKDYTFDFALTDKRTRVLHKMSISIKALWDAVVNSMHDKKVIRDKRKISRWSFSDYSITYYRKPKNWNEKLSAAAEVMNRKGSNAIYFYKSLQELTFDNSAFYKIKKQTGVRRVRRWWSYYNEPVYSYFEFQPIPIKLKYHYKDKWNSAEEILTNYKYAFPDGTPPKNSGEIGDKLGSSASITTNGEAYIVNGDFVITKLGSGGRKYAWDIIGGNQRNNLRMQQWDKHDGTSQVWEIRHIGNNKHTIKNKYSGLGVDNFAGNASNRNPINQWTWTGSSKNKEWIFKKAYNKSEAIAIKRGVDGVSDSWWDRRWWRKGSFNSRDYYIDGGNNCARRKLQLWEGQRRGSSSQQEWAQGWELHSPGRYEIPMDTDVCYMIEPKDRQGQVLVSNNQRGRVAIISKPANNSRDNFRKDVLWMFKDFSFTYGGRTMKGYQMYSVGHNNYLNMKSSYNSWDPTPSSYDSKGYGIWTVEQNESDNEYVHIRHTYYAKDYFSNNSSYGYIFDKQYGASGYNQKYRLIETPCNIEQLESEKKKKPLQHSTQYHYVNIKSK